MRKLCVILLCIALLLAGCTAKAPPTGTIPPVVPESVPAETEPVIPESEPQTEAPPVAEPESTALLAVSVPALSEQFIL